MRKSTHFLEASIYADISNIRGREAARTTNEGYAVVPFIVYSDCVQQMVTRTTRKYKNDPQAVIYMATTLALPVLQ
jgi:hypothetical protein|tara:strand:- start:250 stop:477 length:228 start_codon:yes stop_codon:yes gene_type:complete